MKAITTHPSKIKFEGYAGERLNDLLEISEVTVRSMPYRFPEAMEFQDDANYKNALIVSGRIPKDERIPSGSLSWRLFTDVKCTLFDHPVDALFKGFNLRPNGVIEWDILLKDRS